jgi:hypothetical protein
MLPNTGRGGDGGNISESLIALLATALVATLIVVSAFRMRKGNVA